MEQPANGLGATSAYDLACRYNSLFQYSPVAAAACAAAYGMFGSNGGKGNAIGSSNSPFQPLGNIATSSLPSSSSSNLTSSPTSSLSSLVSNNSKQEPSRAVQPDKTSDECDKSKANQSYDNVSDNDASISESSDDEEQNLSTMSECVDERLDVSKVEQKLNTETEKSINNCIDDIEATNGDEQKNDEQESGKKLCAEEHSIGSLMNTLVKREQTNPKLVASVDLDLLRKNLIYSVSQAIENTLDTFCKSLKQDEKFDKSVSNQTRQNQQHQQQQKHQQQEQDQEQPQQPAPKRIRVNEKIGKNSSMNNNSQNFNVSKILSKDNTTLTNKRKLSSNGLPHSDSFPSFNSTLMQTKPLTTPNQSLLTTNLNQKQHLSSFYSAMSHLPYGNANNTPHANGFPGLSSASIGSGASTPSSANSTNSISSLFAAHQHQLLMAAAQAAANGQNSNYLQMAAAANRLFTPYLMDQHTSQPKPNGQFAPAPNHSAMFHSPHKRRRTKVTDTRLSPRNPLIRTGLKTRDESPTNDDDEHDNEYEEQNQEDDSASSGCNESGSTTGSNSRITNGYTNQYDINTENTEYTGYQTSTLSSLHLRKAKLMFFFSRYPSSTILRNYFPDVKFNKANTAQLVKWFSNFREFFYIQMEKFARQHLAEGVHNADDILVDSDSEIFRALNSHYNRNNQLEIPASFCFVIQATLREFFKAIQEGKDMDPSWKKAIYKIIARMDDQIPEYFKSVQWMESLETNI